MYPSRDRKGAGREIYPSRDRKGAGRERRADRLLTRAAPTLRPFPHEKKAIMYAWTFRVEGFTLLELLVVVAMLGILGSLVSLQVAPLLSRTRLDRGARQVAADLQLVRMKAIAQNRRFRITFRPST
ncbi:MAG: prepilin-type N-terminal cleavage/methylation domain-containing protein, partial [Deltaproteobacteria bacterium]